MQKSGGENGNSSSFWSFFKPSQEAVAAAKPSAALAEAEEITLVPKAAKVHGGDPVLILLPDGGRSVSADCRYCLVYEGTNRRHLASCELAPDRRALFSRVPEHDAPETVRLSLHRLAPTPSSSAQPLLSNLEFSFVPDPMTAVAAAIAAAFPSVPSELAELSACASASAAADCDRQLSDALSRLGDENFNRVENFAGLQSSATALYWLAERGWLDSFADLATRRRDGQSMLDTWLSAGEDGGERLRQALLSDSRCPRAALGSPDRLRLWLRAVASACSRRRRRRRPPGPEDAVVRVASWVTPTAAPLVVMTTNLAKSSTASLEQDLALFPGLEASHAREHFHRYGSDSDYDEDAPRETACVQTETGKSMEDLQLPQKRPFDEAKEAASNPETPLHGSRSPACNNYPSSPLTSPSPLPSPSPSPAPAVCVDTVDSATSKSVKSATSALALSASARSISTPSLFGDLNSEQQQGRKKRRSFLSRLGSSYRMKHKQQQHQQQHLAVPQTPGDHDWVLVSSGRCAVCEAKDGAGCRLRCRVCQLTVHSADQCRGRVVACLPAIAETPQQGASAAAPAAATAAVKPEVALAVELFKKKKHRTAATSPTPQSQPPLSPQSSAAATLGQSPETPTLGSSPVTTAAPASPTPSSAESLADLDALTREAASRNDSWANAQEKKLLKQCGEKLVRRCNFVYELVSTEINHLRNIRAMQVVFREPLRRLPPSAAISAAEIEALFPQLDLLERLHSGLLADLRRCEPPAVLTKATLPPAADWAGLAGLGAALRRHLSGPAGTDWLTAYGGFCFEHTVTLQPGLAALTARSAGFANALRDCERSPQAGRKTLLDHYLTVTQRLSKYKTLLPQIAECCQLVAPVDADMAAACADLDSLLQAVNDQVERRHNEHVLGQVAANFQPDQGISAQQHLAGRRLIHSGRLQVRHQEAKVPAVASFGLLLNDSLLLLQELAGGRFAPLSGPAIAGCACLPLMRFAETDAIVRENEGSKPTFFIVVKRPEPKLISVACLSQEDRDKWLRLINKVRDSNPHADERAQEAARRLRQKSAASADLLASMERRDRELQALLNEKTQLWHQLLLLWGCQKQQQQQENSVADVAAAADPDCQPERLCREALSELGRLRRFVRSCQEVSGSLEDADAEADSASLKRSSSSAEEKSAAAISLPKRADTFSGYDAAMTRRPAKRMTSSAAGTLPPGAVLTAEPAGIALREKDKEPKSRRPSMFEMFRRQRDQPTPPPPQPVLSEDPADSVVEPAASPMTPTVQLPDADGLEAIGRLQALVSAMTAALLSERSRLAGRVQTEAELRQEVLSLKSSREHEAYRSQDCILETIRLQRAQLDQERAKFRDERRRETAKIDVRREDADRREEKLRLREEELEHAEARLDEERQLLALKAEQLRAQQSQQEATQSGALSLKSRATAAKRNGETLE
ncbi:hypothetical protein BOX15_Mlig015431g1 [Macrostomum lignano]|uniref:DH domain-containing protein n=1 Tax=Macrostomum lignano TaxID=282301 RepID=A0A267EE98_9PLAT|nr:hypothetical protein BOX15_Mlig015431g1 [Macrostomum lignano]